MARAAAIRDRIRKLFLTNLGKVISRRQIIDASRDPATGEEPENWHQRLSELRVDEGYTILSNRDGRGLKIGQYVMPDAKQRPTAAKRVAPTPVTWKAVLKRATDRCEWREAGMYCGLKGGEIDPVGGGRVKLTADHMSPHSMNPKADPDDPSQWQALCGRHQVTKKNYWDNNTGKLNVYAILQAAPNKEKQAALDFLLDYFGYQKFDDGRIIRKD